MKILIFGGGGMLGSELVRSFAPHYDVWVTYRKPLQPDVHPRLRGVFTGIDATEFSRVESVIETIRPDWVVNCIGLIKQKAYQAEDMTYIGVNGLFPHNLAHACGAVGSSLLHLSTDCVFSGRVGNYSEEALPDAKDIYGMSKRLGEVHYAHCVTVRTSMIGHEAGAKSGLLEWFLSMWGASIEGYKNAIFSGFTTIQLARVLDTIMLKGNMHGLWHAASDPISKFDLLVMLARFYHWEGEIRQNEDFRCNRSLDGTRLRGKIGAYAPAWDEMIAEMAKGARSRFAPRQR